MREKIHEDEKNYKELLKKDNFEKDEFSCDQFIFVSKSESVLKHTQMKET